MKEQLEKEKIDLEDRIKANQKQNDPLKNG